VDREGWREKRKTYILNSPTSGGETIKALLKEIRGEKTRGIRVDGGWYNHSSAKKRRKRTEMNGFS